MVEGARLESVYTATYRGFESHPLCHKIKPPSRVAFFMAERMAMTRTQVRKNGRKAVFDANAFVAPRRGGAHGSATSIPGSD